MVTFSSLPHQVRKSSWTVGTLLEYDLLHDMKFKWISTFLEDTPNESPIHKLCMKQQIDETRIRTKEIYKNVHHTKILENN